MYNWWKKVANILNFLCNSAMGTKQNIKFGVPTWVWYSALGHQLSQQNTKRPDIRLDGEAAVQSSFRSRPLDGEFSP